MLIQRAFDKTTQKQVYRSTLSMNQFLNPELLAEDSVGNWTKVQLLLGIDKTARKG